MDLCLNQEKQTQRSTGFLIWTGNIHNDSRVSIRRPQWLPLGMTFARGNEMRLTGWNPYLSKEHAVILIKQYQAIRRASALRLNAEGGKWEAVECDMNGLWPGKTRRGKPTLDELAIWQLSSCHEGHQHRPIFSCNDKRKAMWVKLWYVCRWSNILQERWLNRGEWRHAHRVAGSLVSKQEFNQAEGVGVKSSQGHCSTDLAGPGHPHE